MHLEPDDLIYVSEMLAAIRFFIDNLEELPIEEREPFKLRLHLAEASLEVLAEKVKQYYPASNLPHSSTIRTTV